MATRIPKVEAAQFINIQTPETAYILGLLWADGHVQINSAIHIRAVMINIVAEDFDDVEKAFDTTGKWNKYVTKKHSGRTQRTARTFNRELVEYLDAMGYRSKAGYPHILKDIPEHLRHYWFRGLMDGDGCFYIAPKHNSYSICGPADQDWSYLTTQLDSLNVRYRVNITEDSSSMRSVVSHGHLQAIVRWGEYIYKGYEVDKIGLGRKWDKFVALRKRYLSSPWHKRNGNVP